jgi:hypothetical protein
VHFFVRFGIFVFPYSPRARAMQMQFSNHNLNKSRGGEVERLVNLF